MALKTDLDTPKALGFLLKWTQETDKDGSPAAWAAWKSADTIYRDVLGILTEDPTTALAQIDQRIIARRANGVDAATFVSRVESLLQQRAVFRQEKNYAQSDVIRLQLESLGVVLMDTPNGTLWTLKSN